MLVRKSKNKIGIPQKTEIRIKKIRIKQSLAAERRAGDQVHFMKVTRLKTHSRMKCWTETGREPFKIRHIKTQKWWFEDYKTWRILWLWVNWSPSLLHYFSHSVQLQQRRPSSCFAFWTSGLGLVCLKCRPTTRPLHWSSASAKVSVNFLSVGDFELGGRDILKRCLSFLCFSRWNRRRDET